VTAVLRPLTAADLPACEAFSSRAFFELDTRTYQRAWPDPAPRAPDRAEAWINRTLAFLRTDPGGCWAAELDGEVVGFATSLRRETLWILASYAVRPGLQGQGIGRELLGAAASHGQGCLRAMLNSSQDQQAIRRYRQAGFDTLPQVMLWGHVDRSLLPVVERVRPGSAADYDLMDSLDRRTRHAGHGPDHAVLAAQFRLLVMDHHAGQGYAWVDERGSVACLAADSRRSARSLLWEALAASTPEVPVEITHVSPANQWALEVATEARLEIHPRGFLALRGMKDPTPYIPHSTLL
jgi:GNAT superfamily N-acetyltransferase